MVEPLGSAFEPLGSLEPLDSNHQGIYFYDSILLSKGFMKTSQQTSSTYRTKPNLISLPLVPTLGVKHCHRRRMSIIVIKSSPVGYDLFQARSLHDVGSVATLLQLVDTVATLLQLFSNTPLDHSYYLSG
jgi:hypothetical protein